MANTRNQLEIARSIPRPIELPAGTGVAATDFGANEFCLINSTLSPATVFIDTVSIYVPARIKTLMVITAGTITWAGAGQATIQLFSSRTAKAQRTGATTQITGADEVVLGSAANWGGGAATTLANQAWFFSPTQLAELQWVYPYLGVEFHFPAAPSQGSITVAALYAAAW